MSLFKDAKETTYYTYRDGKLYRNAVAGQFVEKTRATRNAGRYKIYADAFPDAALPYTVYHIADTQTGKVYGLECTHYAYRVLERLVEELK